MGPVQQYITQHHNTISQYIVTCLIYNICMKKYIIMVSTEPMRLQQNVGVDVLVSRTMAQASAEVMETDEEWEEE